MLYILPCCAKQLSMKTKRIYVCNIGILYTGLFSPYVIFALLQLQMFFSRLEIAQMELCEQRQYLQYRICPVFFLPFENEGERGEYKKGRMFPCLQHDSQFNAIQFTILFYVVGCKCQFTSFSLTHNVKHEHKYILSFFYLKNVLNINAITFFASQVNKYEPFCTGTSFVSAYSRIITPCALFV